MYMCCICCSCPARRSPNADTDWRFLRQALKSNATKKCQESEPRSSLINPPQYFTFLNMLIRPFHVLCVTGNTPLRLMNLTTLHTHPPSQHSFIHATPGCVRKYICHCHIWLMRTIQPTHTPARARTNHSDEAYTYTILGYWPHSHSHMHTCRAPHTAYYTAALTGKDNEEKVANLGSMKTQRGERREKEKMDK